MCIIVTKEKNAKPIDEKVFENCWDNNPDGAGILFHDGKSATLIKGIMKKEEFLEKVKLANKEENSFIIHTRIATHGSVKPENTHPFVSDTLGFAHNGTMPIEPLKDRTDSESFFLWTIAEKDFEWCKENKFLLDLATHGSRCVVFDMRTGDMIHLCEKDWKDDKDYPGCMFSNASYTYKKWQQPKYDYQTNRYYGSYGGVGYYGDDLFDFDLDDDCTSYKYTKKDKEQERLNKERINKVQADCLKRNKRGLITGVYKWVEMYLNNFAEKGGHDRRLIIQKIKELDEYVDDFKRIQGIYDMETNAINVMKYFIDIAHSLGYYDYKSILAAYKEMIQGIYAENKETEEFIVSLETTRQDYK